MSDNGIENEKKISTAYQAANQHWTHAEQVRWSILYNFLMASSILLLAWSTIYTNKCSLGTLTLHLFSAVGFLISIMWLMIGSRVNKFIKRYGALGEKLEDGLDLKEYGPFHCGQLIRSEEKTSKSLRNIFINPGSFISSSFIVFFVPLIFAVLYIVLFIISFL